MTVRVLVSGHTFSNVRAEVDLLHRGRSVTSSRVPCMMTVAASQQLNLGFELPCALPH